MLFQYHHNYKMVYHLHLCTFQTPILFIHFLGIFTGFVLWDIFLFPIISTFYDVLIIPNTDLLPLEVSDSPWLYENNNEGAKSVDTGKWMLFYDMSLMNEAWVLSKKLYREI